MKLLLLFLALQDSLAPTLLPPPPSRPTGVIMVPGPVPMMPMQQCPASDTLDIVPPRSPRKPTSKFVTGKSRNNP